MGRALPVWRGFSLIAFKSVAPQSGKVRVTFMKNTDVYQRPNPALLAT
jgi:hypothetical protein